MCEKFAALSQNALGLEPYNSDDSRAEYRSYINEPAFSLRHADPLGYFSWLSGFGVIDMKLELSPVLPHVLRNRNCSYPPLRTSVKLGGDFAYVLLKKVLTSLTRQQSTH
jgi:hypothetical protein